MSGIIDFSVPCDLVTPVGTLTFNDPSAGGLWQLDPRSCQAVAPLRNSEARTNSPVFDGSILNDRWFEGYVLNLAVRYLVDSENPACDSLLQEMHDYLMGIIRSLPRADSVSQNRFRFTPEGQNRRIYDKVKLLREAQIQYPNQGPVICSFVLDSPYPYAIDLTQTSPAIAGVHVNAGTAKFYPVLRINSGATAFTIENTSNGDRIVYIGDAIGGSYGELDTFKGTFFQDGDDASELPGIDSASSTEQFGLEPGSNTITMSGGSGTMLLNNAWA